VTCTYCGCRNAEHEIRCRRCGRKPGDTLGADFPLRTDGALATAPQPASKHSARAASTPDLSRAVQRPLFQDRPAPNVIPFETYAPVELRSNGVNAPRPRRADPTKPRKPRASTPRVSEAQASLDFLPAIPDQPRTLGTTVEAVIICEAPVATPIHRAIAAVLDWSMVLLGYGLFLLAYALAGGQFVMGKQDLIIFAATLLLVVFTYGLLWAIAGTETAGMRWVGLRLITFEGFPPEPQQRMLRFAGSCLSLGTIVGLLWSLADEESLGWQDHISRTFPTPRFSESQIFCRH
jgi:uncharacterized RDD family membrane protein YckC